MNVLFLALLTLVASGPSCSSLDGFDCVGNDLLKINGTATAMTTTACCAACAQHPECAVAVLAPNWVPGMSQCLLKSGCPGGGSVNKGRVKVCRGDAAGDEACTGTSTTACSAKAPAAFCDTSLAPAVRAAALVANLTVQEKVDNVGANGAAGVDRLGIPAFQWWGEALHGVCQSPAVSFTPPTPNGTSFPEIIGVGATFDEALFRDMGKAIGREARAMINVGNAGGTFWAPNINIVKDPRWGRLQETPGECPVLAAAYAAAFVANFQNTTGARSDARGRSTDSGAASYVQASSCCKHWAAYSEENWGGVDRFHFDAHVRAQEWADTYLPAFQACIVHGQASGLMCSYNALNGTPTCASNELLTDIARGHLGFDGYVTGDCGAAQDVYTTHHYTSTPKEAADASLAAGMDVDCGSFLKQHLLDQGEGAVNTTAIDAALTRLFATRIRLGLFDEKTYDPWGYKAIRPESIDHIAHQALARRAAAEGMTLLHLQGSASDAAAVSPAAGAHFPLNATQLPHGVAIIGPNADDGPNMQGVDCHGVPPFLITPRDALEQRLGADYVHYAQGCAVGKDDRSGFDAAVAAAANSSATILVMGLSPAIEYEMRDRSSLLLPEPQDALVAAACAAAAPMPCHVVLMSGGVLDVSAMMLNANVSSVSWVGYPGQSGGDAIADVLLGAVAPSGRTPLTWYREAYLYNGHDPSSPDRDEYALSMYDMGLRPNASSTVTLGRTYRFFDGNDTTQLFPFGYGLQLHQFVYSAVELSHTTVRATDIDAVVQAPDHWLHSRLDTPALTNASLHVNCLHSKATRRSALSTCPHSVLAFVVPPGAGTAGRPRKVLAGFARPHSLEADGASILVSFAFTAYDLSLVDENGVRRAVPGKWTILVGVNDTDASAPAARSTVVMVT